MIRTAFEREGPRGDRIKGDVRMPEGPPPRAAIVVVHGFKGFKDWGFFPFVCESLAAEGYAVVSFNFSRNGIGDDPQAFTELDDFAGNTLSRELDELLWMLGQVADGVLLPRKPRRVGLLGHSRGGGDAILATRDSPRVDALVTWAAVSAFDRWTDETRREWRENGRIFVLNSRTGQQMPLDVTLLEDFEENRDRLDVAAAGSGLSVPWLIVHGEADLTVDVEEGKALARGSAAARLLLVPDAGHTLEVGHPFGEPSEALRYSLRETSRHFRRHLGEP